MRATHTQSWGTSALMGSTLWARTLRTTAASRPHTKHTVSVSNHSPDHDDVLLRVLGVSARPGAAAAGSWAQPRADVLGVGGERVVRQAPAGGPEDGRHPGHPHPLQLPDTGAA